MPIFSRPVESVARTRLFARVVGGERGAPPRQHLVCSTQFSAPEDLALILPLPTPPEAGEDAVRFVDLSGYPGFFDDFGRGFGEEPASQATQDRAPPNGSEPLAVQDVGAYEASFVPRRADFSRLDPRFRLPEAAARALPCPANYGFAVFRRKAGQRQQVHPLALSFPTRNFQQIFFPTAQFYGGEWLRRVSFDHLLYFQGSEAMRLPLGFDVGTHRLGRLVGGVLGVGGGVKPPEASRDFARAFVDLDAAQGLVDGDLKVLRFVLRATLPNRDVVLWPRYHERAGDYP